MGLTPILDVKFRGREMIVVDNLDRPVNRPVPCASCIFADILPESGGVLCKAGVSRVMEINTTTEDPDAHGWADTEYARPASDKQLSAGHRGTYFLTGQITAIFKEGNSRLTFLDKISAMIKEGTDPRASVDICSKVFHIELSEDQASAIATLIASETVEGDALNDASFLEDMEIADVTPSDLHRTEMEAYYWTPPRVTKFDTRRIFIEGEWVDALSNPRKVDVDLHFVPHPDVRVVIRTIVKALRDEVACPIARRGVIPKITPPHINGEVHEIEKAEAKKVWFHLLTTKTLSSELAYHMVAALSQAQAYAASISSKVCSYVILRALSRALPGPEGRIVRTRVLRIEEFLRKKRAEATAKKKEDRKAAFIRSRISNDRWLQKPRETKCEQ